VRLPGVEFIVTPREAVRGRDTLHIRLQGLAPRSIDVLSSIDGQPMPAIQGWLLDANRATSVFVDSNTRPGLYRFRAVKESGAGDPGEWIRVDAEVVVR
jgi:hypothetical protein